MHTENFRFSGQLRHLAEGSAAAFILLACITLSACDDGSAPPQPSRLEIEAGDAQSGVVAAALAVEPRVRVLSSNGKRVRGVTVTFQVSAGGGTVTSNSAVTDSRGIASAGEWTIGSRAGSNTLSASVSGLSAINFSATGTAGAASALRALTLTSQNGVVGNTAGAAPSVLVSDAHDNPVAGVLVTFNILAGGGSVGSAAVTTQADGVASAGSWTLGGLAGTQSVSATAAAIAGSLVVFNATAQAGAASKLTMKVQPPGTATNGSTLPAQPVVQISNAFGNAVPSAGVLVTAAVTGATLVNQQATTDAAGAATFNGLALTGLVGSYSLRFSASGLDAVDASPVVLSPGAASKLGIAAGPQANVVSGAVFSPQFVIEVQDASGNLVAAANVQVSAALAAGTGVLGGTDVSTAVQGRASFNNLMYTGSGPIRLRFSAANLAPALTSDIAVDGGINCSGPLTLDLTFTLGQTARYRPECQSDAAMFSIRSRAQRQPVVSRDDREHAASRRLRKCTVPRPRSPRFHNGHCECGTAQRKRDQQRRSHGESRNARSAAAGYGERVGFWHGQDLRVRAGAAAGRRTQSEAGARSRSHFPAKRQRSAGRR